MTKAFIVSTGLLKTCMEPLLPDWNVFSVGEALAGWRFDEIVVAEDYSDRRYTSTTWRRERTSWFETLACTLAPEGKWLWLTLPVGLPG
jgi:hypothetical protein